MKIIITGATGMVGEGVLLECLQDPRVTELLMLNRRPYALQHPKLKELLVADFTQLQSVSSKLSGYDACFFCAGVSSVGMKEDEYTRITYDLTTKFAAALLALNPAMVFTYVSGSGTDSTEKGGSMWARVKGRTENALMKMPFKAVYNFRPGIMKPTKGQVNIKPIFKILVPVLSPFFFGKTLTMKQVGHAMINAVDHGYTKHVLEIKDIRQLPSTQ
jgi:uncharacterized protein YbjT (DUF2867 family)